ncbi:MAG: hypothetical protein FWB90_00435 [Fibromonadales bacterium]|nr:hypothetical protein [Fibromonadales bacterium]
MNRIIYAIFLFPTLIFAQTIYEFDVSYGFGASELSYNSVPGAAFTIYPIEKFGFSAGIQYSLRWSSKTSPQKGANPITVDSEGDSLIFKYSIDRYKEELYGKILQFPIMMKYSDDSYYTAAGLKIGKVLNVGADISYKGLKTEGYYPEYNLTLTEPFFQGFGNYKDSTLKTKNSSKILAMLALEGGVKLKVSENFTLMAGAFADYSFNKGFEKSLAPTIERVETPSGVKLLANNTWKSWSPWSVGAVVKISFITVPETMEVAEEPPPPPPPPPPEPEPQPIPEPPPPPEPEPLPPDTSSLPAFLLNRKPDFEFNYPETRTSPSDSLHILQVSQIADTLKANSSLQLHCVGYSEQMISEALSYETAWQRALRIHYALSQFYGIEENRIFIYSQGSKKQDNRRAECFLHR